MAFDRQWAEKKLNRAKCEREADQYIRENLPELKEMEPGLVIDIGPGAGHFLAACRGMGHEVLGIDAPSGVGGMGDAYREVCKERWTELNVEVMECGLETWFGIVSRAIPVSTDANACLVNLRGSIEQAFASHMTGPPHHEHHQCKLLDWLPEARIWFSDLMEAAWQVLRPKGVLMIHANGTASTDLWYSDAITKASRDAGFMLVKQSGLLLHKWRKP